MSGTRAFSDPDRVHGDIVINWRSRPVTDVVAFAAGYKNAAHELVASLERAVSYPDHRGYPVLFLFRHSVELYLKALAYRAAQLYMLETDLNIAIPRLWREHSLPRLLETVKPILAALDPDCARGYKNIPEEVAEIIGKIDALDPASYAFRYPVTSVGEPALPHHLVVNVLVYAAEVQPVLDWLSGACLCLDETFRVTAEAKDALTKLVVEESNAT
jgi:hypothetical protein